MRLGPMLAACIVAFSATIPAIASAEEPTAYDRLIDEALVEFDAGRFQEALSAFEQAYKEKPSARALRGVAKALFELRSYTRCLETIDRALASDVDPLPENLRSDLESLKGRALRFVGEANIDVAPPDATIVLDGKVLALEARHTATLDVGTHTIEASAPDHQSQVRRFEIHGREVTPVVMRLEPVRAVINNPNPPLPRPTPPDNRTLPLVLAIGGVVASTGALVGSSIWLVDRGDAVDRCNGAAGVGARCANDGSIAFQQDAATTTLVLSGAALVVSAVALWFVLRDPKPAPTTAWAW